VFTVGVGTVSGGEIPEAPTDGTARSAASLSRAMSPLRSSLDRASLLSIATSGGGKYFDLDRESDRQIASTIIDHARRRAGARGLDAVSEDLYWYCLLAAAGLLCLGTLFLRDHGELWLHGLWAALALLGVWMLSR
jgi:hypothetical protein